VLVRLSLLCCLVWLTSCSLYSREKRVHYADAEGRVPAQLFTTLQQGSPNRSALLAQLGPPLRVQALGGAGQLYSWALTQQQQTRTEILLLYRSRSLQTQRSYLHLVFMQDVLVKHWFAPDLEVNTQALVARRDLEIMAESAPTRASTPRKSAGAAPGLSISAPVTTEFEPVSMQAEPQDLPPYTRSQPPQGKNPLYDF
jgi:hypothetical protein